jgi:hypothetical protein
MTEEAAESAEETAGSTDETADTAEDTRRRFREALERKKHENHKFNEHHEAAGKGVGHSQVLSGRRQFRRKSG